mmetsp:Transcript_82342/g.207185  ORF Transcript_82342/g.207185 Transcript_82342/m.207185 type:complete len:218 (-) Transcript_82342:206-859(-)
MGPACKMTSQPPKSPTGVRPAKASASQASSGILGQIAGSLLPAIPSMIWLKASGGRMARPHGDEAPAASENQGWNSVMMSNFWLRVKGKRGPTLDSKSILAVSKFVVFVPTLCRTNSKLPFTGLMLATLDCAMVCISPRLRPTLAVPLKTTRPSKCSIQISTCWACFVGSGLAKKARTGCRWLTGVTKCTEIEPVSNQAGPKACKSNGVNWDQCTVP